MFYQRPQKRSPLHTQTGVEKHLRFHYLHHYRCHYLFFTMVKTARWDNVPPFPFISQPIPPPAATSLCHPFPQDIAWALQKEGNKWRSDKYYILSRPGAHSIMTIMIIYEMAINRAVTLWWVACGGGTWYQYQCWINCCSTALLMKCTNVY